MIVCPNCNHQNPDGGVQCEACYTPLPATASCPNCGATVQADASFCGQCGFSLKSLPSVPQVPVGSAAVAVTAQPDSASFEPQAIPAPVAASQSVAASEPMAVSQPPIVPEPAMVAEPAIASQPSSNNDGNSEAIAARSPVLSAEATAPEVTPIVPIKPAEGRTQLQQQIACLLHTQTSTTVELPSNLTVIHVGKPNDRIPPDIDVSGFPNSEIVSRIHADIRLEGDAYFIEDVGSSNGTYINNLPLPIGNRHRLRPGDRVALGKGDKVTFLFQLS